MLTRCMVSPFQHEGWEPIFRRAIDVVFCSYLLQTFYQVVHESLYPQPMS